VTEQVVIDTGPIVALLNPNDSEHNRCIEAVRRVPLPMVSCWAVMTEAAYLLRRVPKGLELLMRFCDTAVEIADPGPDA